MARTAIPKTNATTGAATNSAATTGESAELVEFLSRSDTYPDHPAKVELRETHISWVFLTERHAYKLKKPVCFEFLDFREASARQHFCLEEVRLNRRLAPQVYLGVVPIRRNRQGHLSLGGEGRPVDWVVQMRRLPDEATLERQIAEGGPSSANLEQLAETLADFYTRLPPELIRTGDYLREIERHVVANFEELRLSAHGLSPLLVRQVHGAQLRLLRLAPWLLENRARDGRVAEGHGDLRPEHIYLLPQPVAIDCLEFSPELRRLDVADELAFLDMECRRLGGPQVGQRVCSAYRAASGDDPAPALQAFYRCYRACVRAKVHVLRSDQEQGRDRAADLRTAETYLELAADEASQLGPATLLVVRGLMGSGKSTLAAGLAESLGAAWLATDVVRRDLLGPSPAPAVYGAGHYRPELRAQVYDDLLARAGERLQAGVSVVLDGTFLACELRQRALALAETHGARVLFVECRCPDEIARQRIEARASRGEVLSEARGELLARQRGDEEPSSPDLPTLEVDTTAPPTALAERVVARLREQYADIFGAPPPGSTAGS